MLQNIKSLFTIALVVSVSELVTARTHHGTTLLPRPTVLPSPYHPTTPFVKSPRRTKTCFVDALGKGQDDGPQILAAFHKCNNGGTVAFLDPLYTIGTALDLTFLSSVDIAIQGTLQFTNDIDYWEANAFKQIYQNATVFWQIGGTDVNIYGNGVGTLDGNGQVWYDRYAVDIYVLRPILLGIIGLHGGSVSGLKLRRSPQWYNFIANSTNVIYDKLDISGASSSINPAKNTDGWDVYRSNSVIIQNSYINNGDDCVSFKPNSTNIIVQGLQCNGSHGISVGSLGQYALEYDVVANITVFNTSMSNASDGARIKVWPGVSSALSGDLQGGGGTGLVKNVTYDTFYNTNNDYAIELTQCYGQKNLTLCSQFPSSLVIEDIYFKNFYGTSSKKYDPIVGTLVCSSPDVCNNIWATNINITPPSGKVAKWTCTNVDNSTLAINCS